MVDREVALRRAGLNVQPVPRIEDPTAEKLRRVVADGRGPMLFAGLVDDWPARAAWTPEHLAATNRHKTVTALMDLPSEGVLFPEDQLSFQRTLTFPEFLDRMLTAGPEAPCYLAYTRGQELLPPGDYDFDRLLGSHGQGTDTRVWLGSAGTRSMLHSDLKDNLFCQIWGEKHVVLLPWEHSLAAYPFPDNIVNSRVDLAHVDLGQFPRLRRTVLYSAVVRPGDVVFIPRGVWHDFRSLTPSISLNHWFGPRLTARDYLGLVVRMGPRCWAATARDFVVHGLLRRREPTFFFFSPPSTGKRFYDALRWGNFSRTNDPASE
jgi:cupin-like protein